MLLEEFPGRREKEPASEEGARLKTSLNCVVQMRRPCLESNLNRPFSRSMTRDISQYFLFNEGVPASLTTLSPGLLHATLRAHGEIVKSRNGNRRASHARFFGISMLLHDGHPGACLSEGSGILLYLFGAHA